ncbi:MAG: sialate O-acetylesterase [Pseudomonadota bacterium]
MHAHTQGWGFRYRAKVWLLALLAAATSTLTLATPARAEADLRVQVNPRGTVSWKLIQRTHAGGAPMPLRVNYALPNAGQLQARIVLASSGDTLPGQDYADNTWAVEASDGTPLEQVIDEVPTGGNYHVLLRLVDGVTGDVAAEATIEEVAVGDVYLAAGQSNMAGYAESRTPMELPIDEVHLFGNDYAWKRGTEPMDGFWQQVDLVSLDFPSHSLMLRFAKDVYSATGVPIAIIPGPLGGSSLATQWQRDFNDTTNRDTLYGSLLYRTRLQNYGAAPAGVLWFQGESDAITTFPAYYRRLLRELIASYRADLQDPQMPFIVGQLGTYAFSFVPTWIAVQEAQRLVAREDAHVALATAIDQPTWDTIHYTVEGYKTIGSRFALAAREMIYGQAVDSLTELQEVTLGADGASVLLHYDAEVFAGEARLYSVTDEAGINTVASTSAMSNVITLTLSRPISGRLAEVLYGNSRLFERSWALGASGIAVPAFRVLLD